MKTIDCWIRVIRKSSLHWTRHVERSTLNFQFIRFSLLNWTINNINASFTWIGFSSVNKSKRLALTLFPLSSHYFLFTFLEFRFNVGSVCALVLSMYVCVCVAFKMCIFIIQARDRIERKMYVLSWFFFFILSFTLISMYFHFGLQSIYFCVLRRIGILISGSHYTNKKLNRLRHKCSTRFTSIWQRRRRTDEERQRKLCKYLKFSVGKESMSRITLAHIYV